MAFNSFESFYNLVKHGGDGRSSEYPFVKDPIYVILACFSYIVLITLGPKIMEGRKALQLRGVMIAYNLFSVIFSIWMVREFFASTMWNPKFNVFCQDYNESDRSPLTMRLINVQWWYTISKFIEYLDTFFFIVRKKSNQISFLHIYHHIGMLLLQWALLKYNPGGVSYLAPLVNSFIHSLMYTYYLLAAFGPHMQKYLWWKRYLTVLQIIQFMIGITYIINFNRIGCRFVHWIAMVNQVFLVILLYLFVKFYMKSYKSHTKVKKVN